jgi:hypothetical protein
VARERGYLVGDGEEVARGRPGLVKALRSLVGGITASVVRAAPPVLNFPGMQPVQCIADVAAEVGTDVSVVGTRGHPPVGGVFAGSVANIGLR